MDPTFPSARSQSRSPAGSHAGSTHTSGRTTPARAQSPTTNRPSSLVLSTRSGFNLNGTVSSSRPASPRTLVNGQAPNRMHSAIAGESAAFLTVPTSFESAPAPSSERPTSFTDYTVQFLRTVNARPRRQASPGSATHTRNTHVRDATGGGDDTPVAAKPFFVAGDACTLPVTTIGENAVVRAIQIVGERVWTAEKDGCMTVYDARSGEAIRKFERKRDFFPLAIAPVAPYVWVGFSDGMVRIFHPDTLVCLKEVKEHQGPIAAIEPSADGENVFTAGADFLVVRWSALTGERLSIMSAHSSPVRCLLARGAGSLLSAGDDGMLVEWSLGASGGVFASATVAHKGAVLSITATADGRVWTGGADGVVRIWRFPVSAAQRAITSPTGRPLAAPPAPAGAEAGSRPTSPRGPAAIVPSGSAAEGPANPHLAHEIRDAHAHAVSRLLCVGSQVWSVSLNTVHVWDAVTYACEGRHHAAHAGYLLCAGVVHQSTVSRVWTAGAEGGIVVWNSEGDFQPSAFAAMGGVRARDVDALREVVREMRQAHAVEEARADGLEMDLANLQAQLDAALGWKAARDLKAPQDAQLRDDVVGACREAQDGDADTARRQFAAASTECAVRAGATTADEWRTLLCSTIFAARLDAEAAARVRSSHAQAVDDEEGALRASLAPAQLERVTAAAAACNAASVTEAASLVPAADAAPEQLDDWAYTQRVAFALTDPEGLCALVDAEGLAAVATTDDGATAGNHHAESGGDAGAGATSVAPVSMLPTEARHAVCLSDAVEGVATQLQQSASAALELQHSWNSASATGTTIAWMDQQRTAILRSFASVRREANAAEDRAVLAEERLRHLTAALHAAGLGEVCDQLAGADDVSTIAAAGEALRRLLEARSMEHARIAAAHEEATRAADAHAAQVRELEAALLAEDAYAAWRTGAEDIRVAESAAWSRLHAEEFHAARNIIADAEHRAEVDTDNHATLGEMRALLDAWADEMRALADQWNESLAAAVGGIQQRTSALSSVKPGTHVLDSAPTAFLEGATCSGNPEATAEIASLPQAAIVAMLQARAAEAAALERRLVEAEANAASARAAAADLEDLLHEAKEQLRALEADRADGVACIQSAGDAKAVNAELDPASAVHSAMAANLPMPVPAEHAAPPLAAFSGALPSGDLVLPGDGGVTDYRGGEGEPTDEAELLRQLARQDLAGTGPTVPGSATTAHEANGAVDGVAVGAGTADAFTGASAAAAGGLDAATMAAYFGPGSSEVDRVRWLANLVESELRRRPQKEQRHRDLMARLRELETQMAERRDALVASAAQQRDASSSVPPLTDRNGGSPGVSSPARSASTTARGASATDSAVTVRALRERVAFYEKRDEQWIQLTQVLAEAARVHMDAFMLLEPAPALAEALHALSFLIDFRPTFTRAMVELLRVSGALQKAIDDQRVDVQARQATRQQAMERLETLAADVQNARGGCRWIIGNFFTDPEVHHLGLANTFAEERSKIWAALVPPSQQRAPCGHPHHSRFGCGGGPYAPRGSDFTCSAVSPATSPTTWRPTAPHFCSRLTPLRVRPGAGMDARSVSPTSASSRTASPQLPQQPRPWPSTGKPGSSQWQHYGVVSGAVDGGNVGFGQVTLPPGTFSRRTV